MHLLRACRRVVAVLLVAGCGDPTSALWPIDVTLAIDRSAVAPGEPATLTLVATNRSDDPVTIVTSHCGAIQVRTLLGIVVGPPREFCLSVLTKEELAPGESHVFERSWDGRGFTDGGSTVIQLPPDEYLLRGRVRIWEDRIVWSDQVRVRVEE